MEYSKSEIKEEALSDIIQIQKQKVRRDYYKQLYVTKLDNPDEMEKFLKIYNLPKINQE